MVHCSVMADLMESRLTYSKPSVCFHVFIYLFKINAFSWLVHTFQTFSQHCLTWLLKVDDQMQLSNRSYDNQSYTILYFNTSRILKAGPTFKRVIVHFHIGLCFFSVCTCSIRSVYTDTSTWHVRRRVVGGAITRHSSPCWLYSAWNWPMRKWWWTWFDWFSLCRYAGHVEK